MPPRSSSWVPRSGRGTDMRAQVVAGISMVVLLASPSEAGFLGGDAARSPGQQLKTLFAEFWDDELRADPLEATFVGDHRYDDRLADLSETAHQARLARDRAHREALANT